MYDFGQRLCSIKIKGADALLSVPVNFINHTLSLRIQTLVVLS